MRQPAFCIVKNRDTDQQPSNCSLNWVCTVCHFIYTFESFSTERFYRDYSQNLGCLKNLGLELEFLILFILMVCSIPLGLG